MLPTPSANLGDNGGPQHPDKRRAGGHSVSIEDAIHGLSMLPTTRATTGGSSTETVAMLPTPAAGVFNDGEDVEQWQARRERVKAELGNGNGFGMPLGIAVAMLPTPVVKNNENRQSEGYGPNLGTALGLLPTPSVADTQGGRKHRSGARNDELLLNGIAHHEQFGQYAAAVARQEAAFGYPAPSPTEPAAKPLNRHGNPRVNPRLSARFAEWMMGSPPGWITDVPGVTRSEALRLAGNGVVHPQAAAVLRDMLPHALAALAERQAA